MASTSSSCSSKLSVKDVVSASTEKLQPLPVGSQERLSQQAEKEWLETMTEKAGRAACEPAVQFALGQHHFSHQDYAQALKYFEKAAGLTPGEAANSTAAAATAGSSAQAKYQLGVMYYDGLGVKEDPVKGSAFMLQVAQCSTKKDCNIIPSAQYNIGRAYFMGFGVPQSDSKAEKWWCAAAAIFGDDPSSIRARHTLGLYYSRQESHSLEKSCKWHLAAAEAGSSQSMAALGVMMIQGQGCDKDTVEGLEWLKRSAKRGCAYGEGLLSRQYLAMKLYSKACEAAFRVSDKEHPEDGATPLSRLECIGLATGCFVLARCLQLGNGIAKDEAKAMTYYNKAKRFDKSVTIEMYDQMTQDQL